MPSSERKRAYDRARQQRLYAEGKSYKQLHPENQQLCDWNRSTTSKRLVRRRTRETGITSLGVVRFETGDLHEAQG